MAPPLAEGGAWRKPASTIAIVLLVALVQFWVSMRSTSSIWMKTRYNHHEYSSEVSRTTSSTTQSFDSNNNETENIINITVNTTGMALPLNDGKGVDENNAKDTKTPKTTVVPLIVDDTRRKNNDKMGTKSAPMDYEKAKHYIMDANNRSDSLGHCTPPMKIAKTTFGHYSNNRTTWTARIPPTIHMLSKTKCMTEPFLKNIDRWRFPNHSLLVHDDESANLLFSLHDYWSDIVPDFHDAIQCLPNYGASSASKADVWRYVILWVQGGIYTDIDNVPGELFAQGLSASFNNQQNDDNDNGQQRYKDAAIVLRPDKQHSHVHKAGQSFLLMSPQHPLMYLCWKIAVNRLLALPDLARQRAYTTTGPDVLDAALAEFLGTTRTTPSSLQPGTFSISHEMVENDPFLRRLDPALTQHRTVTLLSNGTLADVQRYIKTSAGVRAFEKMEYYNLSGMVVWQKGSGDDRHNVSCAQFISNSSTPAAAYIRG